MDLSRYLKGLRHVPEVLKSVARCLNAPERAAEIARDIDEGRICPPHRTTICRCFIKADCMMMLWRRQHVVKEGVMIARYASVDARPQGGYDYFVCHQEVMARDEMAPVDRDDVLGGLEWGRYMLTITCLGVQNNTPHF